MRCGAELASPLPSARRKARSLLVQALYQWQLSGDDLSVIESQFVAQKSMLKADRAFFSELFHQIPRQLDDIDGAYRGYLDRDITALDPVSRAILRIGTYELLHRLDVPYRVAINEAVNLAKTFGPTEAHRFINGVMDKVAAQARAIEVAADGRHGAGA